MATCPQTEPLSFAVPASSAALGDEVRQARVPGRRGGVGIVSLVASELIFAKRTHFCKRT